MRLIDADELHFSMTDSIDQGIAENARDEAPTVEAIPIEYIREHMNGFYDNGYNEFGSALEALIMDWEEEHG